MTLSNSTIKKIILVGGVLYLIVRFRGFLNPSKAKLDAKSEDKDAIGRAIDKIKNGGVEVASTPDEIKNV